MDILYLNKNDIGKTGTFEAGNMGLVWETVKTALIQFGKGRGQSPLDQFLRPMEEGCFNRIIAKAAFIEMDKMSKKQKISGLKWIASAPTNILRGLPRANGLVILNDTSTGKVLAIMDAAPINSVRTAAVTVISYQHFYPDFERFVVFGAGIIGTEHLRQILLGCSYGLFKRLKEICLFDLERQKAEMLLGSCKSITEHRNIKIKVAESFEDCFTDNSAVTIATNALNPHLGKEHVEGRKNFIVSHVSLRDYLPEALLAFDDCVVDSWEHVAREGTTIDLAHKEGLIGKNHCLELIQVLRNTGRKLINRKIIINPMGLVVTDLAIAWMIYEDALQKRIGTFLDEG